MSKQPRVFLAHAKEDKDAVRQLYVKLVSRGFKPWLDEEELLPGQNWRIEISKAIKQSDVFAACLSKKSVEKQGYVQREFRIALDEYAERPPGSIFFIPVKLDDCEIPDLQIPQLNIALRDFHWVEIWRQGAFERLAGAIEYAAGKRQTGAPTVLVPSSVSPELPEKAEKAKKTTLSEKIDARPITSDKLQPSPDQEEPPTATTNTSPNLSTSKEPAEINRGRQVGEETEAAQMAYFSSEVQHKATEVQQAEEIWKNPQPLSSRTVEPESSVATNAPQAPRTKRRVDERIETDGARAARLGHGQTGSDWARQLRASFYQKAEEEKCVFERSRSAQAIEAAKHEEAQINRFRALEAIERISTRNSAYVQTFSITAPVLFCLSAKLAAGGLKGAFASLFVVQVFSCTLLFFS